MRRIAPTQKPHRGRWRPKAARYALWASGLLIGLLSVDAAAQFNARGRGPSRGANSRSTDAPRAAKNSTNATPSTPPASEDAHDEALIKRYQNLIFEKPGEEVPLMRLAELVRQRDGNLKTLFAMLEERARTTAELYPTLVAWGGLLAQDDQKAEAKKKLSQATEISPERPEAWLLLSAIEQQQGKSEEARSSMQRALPRLSGPERSMAVRTLRDLSLDIADYESAAKYHRVLCAESKGNLFLQGELGRELSRRGQSERAIQELDRVVQQARGDARALAPALRDLGEAELGARQTQAAIETLAKASRHAVTSPGLRASIDTLRAEAHRQTGTLPAFLEDLAATAGTASRLGLLGSLYEETGETEKAVTAYRKALALEPQQVDLRMRLVRLYEARGELDAAVSEYGELIKSSPRDVQLSIRYMDMLLAQGQRGKAISELDRIDRLSSGDPTAGLLLLDIAERLEETGRTQKMLARLSSSAGGDPRFLVELGARYYQAGETEKAHNIWKKILTTQKDRAAAHVLYGEVLIDHEAVDEGVASLTKAAELSSSDPKTHRALALGLQRAASQGKAESRQKYERDALAAWQQLLKLSAGQSTPDAIQDRSLARNHIVRIWKATNRLSAALIPLKKSLNAQPPDVEAGRLLAEGHIAQGSDRQAIAVLKQVLILDPGDRQSLLMLEAAHTRSGQHDEAIATLQQLVTADPRRAREYYERMARAASLKNDWAGALKFAELAVEKNPNDPTAQASLGDLYAARGQTQKAESFYRKALSLDDQLHPVSLKLAELLAKTERSEEALSVLFRVIRTSRSEEVIRVSTRRALSLSVPLAQTRKVEDVLRPLSIGRPEQRLYRSLLLEVLSSQMYPLLLASTHGAPEARASAQRSLTELADRSTGPLLAALADDNASEQQIAISLLSHGGTSSAGSALLAFAEGPAKEEQRLMALLALGRLSLPNSAQRLSEMVVTEGTVRRGRLAQAALWALTRSNVKEAQPALISSLREGDPEMRAYAALGLADAGWLSGASRSQAVNEVITLLNSKERGSVARAAAALALGRLLGPGHSPTSSQQESATSALLSASQESSPLLARAALISLPQISQNSFVKQRVANGLISPNDTVRSSATRAAAALADPRSAGIASLLPERLEATNLSATDRVLHALAPSDAALPLGARSASLLFLHVELTEEARVGLRASPETAHAVLDLLEPAPNADGRASPPLLAPESYSADGPHGVRAQQRATEVRRDLLEEIIALANGPNPELRNHALRVLRATDSPEAAQALTTGLRTAAVETHQAALSALSRSPSQASLEILTPYLQEEKSWGRRRRVAQSLGEFLSPDVDETVRARVHALLTELTRDADALVQEEARAQLEQANSAH